jgi:hypothetical protein
MDMIMGHPDRHLGNVLVKDGKLMHIDNDDAFEFRGVMPHKGLAGSAGDVSQEIMSPDTLQWLKSINPKHLAGYLARFKLDPHKAKSALFALRYMQQNADRQNMGAMQDMITNKSQQFHDASFGGVNEGLHSQI